MHDRFVATLVTGATLAGWLHGCGDDDRAHDAGVIDAGPGIDAGDLDAGDEDAGGIDGGDTIPVSLQFAARIGDADFACGDSYTLGTADTELTGADFRFYISEVRLVTSDGAEVPVTLDDDGMFQQGDVALLDFEDGSGPCASGNSAMRSEVTGTVPAGSYEELRFTLGVPFALNHSDAATAEPPLNVSGMFWVWQGGRKFLRIDLAGETPYNVHLGSTVCMSSGPTAPPTEACGRPNRATVQLEGFDLESSVILADLETLVMDADLTANTAASPPGCQSFPSDAEDCGPIFPRLGVDYETGMPTSSAQSFFRLE
jgi:uncharacterized repeat protein (TIGR04052 family)